MKQMPASAFSSVPITISRSRSESIFQPGGCSQDRAGPWAIVSTNGSVKYDRHPDSLPGTPDRLPANPYSPAR
jgi:hypothetical protein